MYARRWTPAFSTRLHSLLLCAALEANSEHSKTRHEQDEPRTEKTKQDASQCDSSGGGVAMAVVQQCWLRMQSAVESCCTVLILHYTHAALYSGCTVLMLHYTHAALYSCCPVLMLHCTHAALYSCCTLLMLHYTHAALYSGCTILRLHCTHAAPLYSYNAVLMHSSRVVQQYSII